MKIQVLMENTPEDDRFVSEHGLSLYIEAGGRKILFDAGQSGAFAENAEKLGVDLTAVDLAILSHGHYDHGGGLHRFMQINSSAPVYLSRHAFEPHFNGAGRDIGLDPALASGDRLVYVDGEMTLGAGLSLHSCNDRKQWYPLEPFGLTMEDGKPEDFRHELYLLACEGEKRILISGCSHKGILNIVQWFQPDVLVGGFHFKQMSPTDPRLTQRAEILRNHPTMYYTGHCTGAEQFAAMKPVLQDRLCAFRSGSTILI